MPTQILFDWLKKYFFKKVYGVIFFLFELITNLNILLLCGYKNTTMKKTLLLMLSILLFSCGASKNVRTQQKIIEGSWQLTSIDYSKTGDYNVTLFNDATTACLIGSSWDFVPNNNTGTYTISKPNCKEGTRDFVFVIEEINENTGYFDFLLKPKNNENNIGFRLNLNQLTENTMVWQQSLMVNGSPFLINMNFTKQ